MPSKILPISKPKKYDFADSFSYHKPTWNYKINYEKKRRTPKVAKNEEDPIKQLTEIALCSKPETKQHPFFQFYQA